MVEYMIADAGMGGLVVILGRAAAFVFGIVAVIILRFSIRAIKNELKISSEREVLNDEEAKAENTDEEV